MFSLPPLPYPYNALEPYIDEETMKLHHDKHHASYVDNLNKTLTDYPLIKDKNIEDLLTNLSVVPENIKQAVINFGGGHYNHSFFWKIMSPSTSGVSSLPSGKLLSAIERDFGSFDQFKEQFSAKAMSVFGSGWVFLIQTPDGKLSIKRHSFQNNPLMQGNKPLLALDLWEHAYYLKYQNRRAEYVANWWNVVNWDEVEKLYS